MTDSISRIAPPLPTLGQMAARTAQAGESQARVTGGASNYAAQASVQARDQTERNAKNKQLFARPRLQAGALSALDPAASAGATHHDEDEPGHAGQKSSKRRARQKVPPAPSF